MALIHCEACANWFDRRTTARPTGISGVGEGECRHGAPHPDVGAGGTGRAHWPGTGPKDFCFEAEAGAPVKEQDLLDAAATPPPVEPPPETVAAGAGRDAVDQPAVKREPIPPHPSQTQAQAGGGGTQSAKEPSHVRKP